MKTGGRVGGAVGETEERIFTLSGVLVRIASVLFPAVTSQSLGTFS